MLIIHIGSLSDAMKFYPNILREKAYSINLVVRKIAKGLAKLLAISFNLRKA
jgi:hypothetical protein